MGSKNDSALFAEMIRKLDKEEGRTGKRLRISNGKVVEMPEEWSKVRTRRADVLSEKATVKSSRARPVDAKTRAQLAEVERHLREEKKDEV